MKQLRNTRQRQLILDVVQAHHEHPSADMIYLAVREKDAKISRGTVYRNLNILVEQGDITQVVVPSADRYDGRKDRHHHAYCVSCGAVCDASIAYHQEQDKTVELATGYQIKCHHLFFEGLCSLCKK